MKIKSTETKYVDGKKVVTKNVLNLPSFDLECQCHSQSLEFAQEIDKDANCIYIDVWETGGRYDAGLWYTLKERIKRAFFILFLGRYRTDYLMISKEQANELKNYLDSLEW